MLGGGSDLGAPADQNLKLGMRMSQDRAQLLIDSHSAQQVANSSHPRYCTFQDVPTVAPYPNADFSRTYTYVYVMLDMPLDQIDKIARIYFDSHEREIPWEEYKAIAMVFSKNGGKYIRTLINMGPTNVWWDGDGEEDFWALPASCDGWEKIEEKLKPLAGLLPGPDKEPSKQPEPKN